MGAENGPDRTPAGDLARGVDGAEGERSTPDVSPARLWYRAEAEHPDDPEATRLRYHALMVEHGHIVKREPGQSVNLPCGWPHRAEPEDVQP